MVRTIFVSIVLSSGAIFFSRDVQTLILTPIENMMKKVRRIAENPLDAAQIEEIQILVPGTHTVPIVARGANPSRFRPNVPGKCRAARCRHRDDDLRGWLLLDPTAAVLACDNRVLPLVRRPVA